MDNLLLSAQRSNIWRVSIYARRTTSSPADNDQEVEMRSIHNASDAQQQNLDAVNAAADLADTGSSSYFAHEVYFAYFYSWIKQKHAELAEPEEMEKRWPFQREISLALTSSANYEGFLVEDAYCSCASMWLVAAVTAALQMHMKPETAAFTLVANTFSESHTLARENSYFDGPLKGRLTKDMGYWGAFAQTRGLMRHQAGQHFDINSLSTDGKKDLEALLHWLIGSPKRKISRANASPRRSFNPGLSPAQLAGWSQTADIVHVGGDGAAMSIIESLIEMGLNIKVDWESEDTDQTGNRVAQISYYSQRQPSRDGHQTTLLKPDDYYPRNISPYRNSR